MFSVERAGTTEGYSDRCLGKLLHLVAIDLIVELHARKSTLVSQLSYFTSLTMIGMAPTCFKVSNVADNYM